MELTAESDPSALLHMAQMGTRQHEQGMGRQ